jgi:hypothetical protein
MYVIELIISFVRYVPSIGTSVLRSSFFHHDARLNSFSTSFSYCIIFGYKLLDRVMSRVSGHQKQNLSCRHHHSSHVGGT